PGDPANILPAALCQGDFEAYTFLETRRVCFSPATVLETYLSAGRCVSALRVCVCVCVPCHSIRDLPVRRYVCFSPKGVCVCVSVCVCVCALPQYQDLPVRR